MVSLYDASIPMMIATLQALKGFLEKAKAKEGVDINAIPDYKICADMLPFRFQVQTACNTAKKTIARLGLGEDVPFADDEKTLDDLIERVSATIKLLEGVNKDSIVSETANVELKLGPKMTSISAKDYVYKYGIPNFFFHVQTAYCLLRANGVELGKIDYLGPHFAGLEMKDNPDWKPRA